MKPIHKFNNGRGATICTKCSVIISTGLTEDLYCEKCKPKQSLCTCERPDYFCDCLLYDEKVKEEQCTCKEHDPYCCKVHGICPTCCPKEEPKQETIKEPCVQCCGTGEIQKSTNRKQSNFECDICSGKGYWNKVIEPKQESLEEVAERFVNNRFTKQICGDEFYPDILASKSSIVESHILFAKWQQERSYSEEEVLEILKLRLKWFGILPDEFEDNRWFEQFKKK
jgi:hypothetical protein